MWGAGGPVMARRHHLRRRGQRRRDRPPYDDSDSVTALSPGLQRTGIFAPVTWRRTTPTTATSAPCPRRC